MNIEKSAQPSISQVLSQDGQSTNARYGCLGSYYRNHRIWSKAMVELRRAILHSCRHPELFDGPPHADRILSTHEKYG